MIITIPWVKGLISCQYHVPLVLKTLMHLTCQAPTTSIIHHSWIRSRIHRNPSYIYAHTSRHTSIPKQLPHIPRQQSTKPHVVSPSPSLKQKCLAQARQSRSDESPSAQARARNKETGTTAGSRLGEIPLAWASGSLAQNVEQVTWATYREKEVGEPSSDSLRRARLAWARLIVLALVHLQQMHYSKPTNHAKNSTHPKQWFIHPTTTNLKKTVHKQYNSNPNFPYLVFLQLWHSNSEDQ